MAMRKWGAETLVNTTTDNGQTAPVVTALQNGGYVVAWTDDMGAGQSVVKFQIYTAGGIKLGTEKTLPVSDGDGDQDQPTITTTANGNFIIGVRDFDSATDHDTMAYEFTPNGPNPGQQVRIFTLNSAAANDGTAPVVDYFGTSNIFLYHQNVNFYAKRISANGVIEIDETFLVTLVAEIGAPFDFVTSKTGQRAGDSLLVMAVGEGAFHRLAIQRVDDDLTDGISRQISTGDFPVEHISVCEFDPPFFLETTFIVAYEVNGRVGFFQSAAAGDSDFGVLENATKPDVMTYMEGQYLMSYRSTTTNDLNLQIFNEDATKFGPPVKINTNGSGANTDPDIEVLADGRILLVWAETSGLDGSGSGIFQQIIDPRDGIVNGSSNPLLAEILYGNDTYNDEINAYAGNDTIYGLAGADAIYGGDGNDFIFGGRGDDTMYGGEGGDNLTGGAGADEFHGGNGTDVANYNDAKLGIVVALDGSVGSQGDAVDDTFIGVENVSGSRFDDTIIGNVENNSLFGGKGNDVLRGLDGNDGLRGGEGGDTMTGGAGNDTFFFNSQIEANGSDVIVDFSSSAALNNDRVALTGAAFGLTAATFTAINFQSGTDSTALTSDVRVFYETDTGILRYDADGSSAGAAIVLATLTGAPTLVFSDVVIL